MLYMLKVYTLLAMIVFGTTGAILLALIAFNEARDYARALRAIRRIALGIRDESLAISRTISRTHETNSRRAA